MNFFTKKTYTKFVLKPATNTLKRLIQKNWFFEFSDFECAIGFIFKL